MLLLIYGFLLVCCEQKNTKQVLSVPNLSILSESAININTASAEELEKLPHVGAKTARKIVEFRNKNGRFRKPEHLLLVDGISDARFREMRNFIKVE
ncbi:MAG TPA: ComEA family DNA-binding protein [Pyrinomonadaceae bacterium]|nr:ComEA family DNA-binding protein [Pyrinomonadaceae bacterium]